MANNPLNLFLRFILELTALFAVGYWGWNTGDGAMAWASAILLPIVVAFLWGVFRVDDDPNPAPIRIPGTARLVLELLILYGGAASFYFADQQIWAYIFAGLITFHYLISYDRIIWLIRQ